MNIIKYNKLRMTLILMLVIASSTSCKKYLDAKPQENLVVATTLKDFQAVMDNTLVNILSPTLANYSGDDYYLSTASWNGLPVVLRRLYVWDGSNFAMTGDAAASWNRPYEGIYQANFVMDGLKKMDIATVNQDDYNALKGAAYFHRGFLFHQLAQQFCKPYATANLTAPGIILKLSADINEKAFRSSVEATYKQIIEDLRTSAGLLPISQPVKTRPTRAAAYGALARTYLSMRDYSNAERYADSSLALSNLLIDYNTLVPASSPALPPLASNVELQYLSTATLSPVFNSSHREIVDSNLYRSYAGNDLRQIVFFGTNSTLPYWKGSYYNLSSDAVIFDGIATDEVYLIRAESRARNGNVSGAMNDLNTLLRRRWRTGTFTDLTAVNAADALTKILVERRKELIFRGLRWSDVRRLNLEGANITLTRVIDNTAYTLPPNDLRSVFLIPQEELDRSGIEQNPR